jgi:hypothetical protein
MTITREELVAKGWAYCTQPFQDCTSFEMEVQSSYPKRSIIVDVGRDSVTVSFMEALQSTGEYDDYHFVTLLTNPTIAYLESLIALLTGQEQTCEWEMTEIKGLWATECDERISTDDMGQSSEVYYKFCPNCGRKIMVKE